MTRYKGNAIMHRTQQQNAIAGRHSLPRLMRLAVRQRPVATRVTRLHAWILRHSRGRVRRSWVFAFGRPVVSLTTTGRRTGRPRSTPVTWFSDGGDIITVAMYLGMERDPDWCLNLQAHPEATIVIAGEPVKVKARRTAGEERLRLWQRWLEIQPVSRRFEPIANREIPVFRLTPLDGRRPRTTATARRVAGKQLHPPASR